MRELLTGPERLSLKATFVRWERDHRGADGRALANAFGALMAERDQLAEQLDNIETRVFQLFIGASADAMDLNAMTAVQLTELVRAAIRGADDAG